ELAQFANFMKTTQFVTKIAADVAAAATAMVSGGTLAWVSAAIIIFFNENPWFNFDNAVKDLANAWGGSIGAQVLAALVVAIATAVVIAGISVAIDEGVAALRGASAGVEAGV